jgi:hypothetical protein
MKRSTYLAARASNTVSRFIRAARLCFLLVFWPAQFEEMEKEHIARLNASERENEEQRQPRLWPVPQTLAKSFFVVVGAVLLGGLIGSILGDIFGCASATTNNGLQIGGAGVLLWGTLFVRGWEIQTFEGETLTERVNRWIYRALSFVGTTVFFCAIFLPQCE